MILDPSDYTVEIKFPQLGVHRWCVCKEWADRNGIPIAYSFDTIYFKEEEHAVLFKLTFGL